MSQTITLDGPTRALADLEHAFQLGRHVERPGVITAAHTAAWHMAGLIEQVHMMQSDFAEELRCRALGKRLVRSGEEPTS